MLEKGSVLLNLVYLVGISVYATLLFKIMSKLTTRYIPYLMKFVKKGFAKREKTRIMRFRGLLQVYLRGKTIIVITGIYVIGMLYGAMKTGVTVQYVIGGTVSYAVVFVVYTLIIFLYEYCVSVKEN